MRPFDVEPDYHGDLMLSRNAVSNTGVNRRPTQDAEPIGTTQEFLRKTMTSNNLQEHTIVSASPFRAVIRRPASLNQSRALLGDGVNSEQLNQYDYGSGSSDENDGEEDDNEDGFGNFERAVKPSKPAYQSINAQTIEQPSTLNNERFGLATEINE